MLERNKRPNYSQRMAMKQKISTLFRANYPAGCIKLSNETLDHATVKFQVGMWFYNNGFKVYSEASLKGTNGRPDIYVCNDNSSYIVEVLHTETEKQFQNKIKNYPKDIPIIKVYTKDFKYDEFKY